MEEPTLNVTKTSLPPLEEYVAYLEGIWSRCHVTNHGPLVADLERQLREVLKVRHLSLVANGTLALQLAIRGLALGGEVITTPFSYVATTSSIVWEHATPVFVDIEPRHFTIDPDRIEEAVTKRTSAIVATHVYGFPCDVERIATIAEKHDLQVVYDAAHAFGVLFKGRPLAAFGDVTALSFHATKVFHTVEGGGVATDNPELAHRVAYMRNHGHRGEENYWGLGVNAKSSELHAAMGLCLLPRVGDAIAARRERVDLYREFLEPTGVVTWRVPETVSWNYGYFPIVFDAETDLLQVREALNAAGVRPRRYFYPSLTDLPYAPNGSVPVAESLARRVLCLPLHPDLDLVEIERVAGIVCDALARKRSDAVPVR